MKRQGTAIACAILWTLGCGPAQEEQRGRGTTTEEEHRGPSERLACSPGNDPQPHLVKIQPWLPPGTTPEVVLETRPMVDDITGEGEDALVFYLRAGDSRFIALIGCQDSMVTGLGVYRMEGLEGVVELGKTDATGIVPGEILVKIVRRDPPALYERWRYLRFDGASLGEIFAITKQNIPPTGPGTRAEISFMDRNGDGLNEVVAMEETLEGDTARARNSDPAAPLPRILGSRQVRFRFDRDQGKYVQETALEGRGNVSMADITAEPQVLVLTDAGAMEAADAGPR